MPLDIMHGMKRGLRPLLSNHVSPPIYVPLVIQGCKTPSLSASQLQCAKGLNPLLQTTALYGQSPFFIFLPTPQDFSDNIIPMKYRIRTKINLYGEVIPSFLED